MGDKPQGLRRLAGQLGAEESWARSTAMGWEAGMNALLWLRSYHTLHLNSDAVRWSPLDWPLREGSHVVRYTSRDTTSGEFLAPAHSHWAPGRREKGIPGEVCTHPFLGATMPLAFGLMNCAF